MTEMLDPITRSHVERAAAALQDEFAGTFSRETIVRSIAESVDLLGESKITVFVPVLAHRFARERLRALGQADGVITKEQPEVLFVCVQNAGRSQLAVIKAERRASRRVTTARARRVGSCRRGRRHGGWCWCARLGRRRRRAGRRGAGGGHLHHRAAAREVE